MVTPPGKFSKIFSKMENGYVAMTLEKIPRACEKGRGCGQIKMIKEGEGN